MESSTMAAYIIRGNSHLLAQLKLQPSAHLQFYYHITYAFQSESTLYNCLNVKELLARNRRDSEV